MNLHGESIKGSVHQDQLVNDLLWVVNSPSLITDSPEVETLRVDQIDSEHLHRTMSRFDNYRVGVYFESLLDYWLGHIRGVEIIAHGLPVRDEKRTLGEIDFVFRDEQGKLTHWEVAVKFYLHDPEQAVDHSHFIGPNARDTFEKKMARMFEHQLPLSHSCFPNTDARHAFVKGQIFYHDPAFVPSTIPDSMSATHSRGTFLRVRHLERLADRTSNAFWVRNKPYWLSAYIPDRDESEPRSGPGMIDHLRQYFAANDRPVLLSQLDRSDNEWVETNRVFVVSDHWPRPSGA